MKYVKFSVAALISLFFLSACAPKAVVSGKPATYNFSQELLEKGNQEYKAGQYEAAIQTYNELIFMFPNTPEAARAMMNNGLLHKELKKYSESRRFFEELISRQPNSPLSNDARIEILKSYLSEGNYQQTIKKASELFGRSHQEIYPTEVYLVVGDAYLESGQPENSLKLYAVALKVASESEREAILEKIKSAMDRISPETLVSSLNTMDDSLPKEDIIYLAGMKQYEAGNHALALSIFNEFLDKYPTHPEAFQVRNMINTLQKEADKGHYSIGVLLPLSGKYAELGQKAWTGIEFAISQFISTYHSPSINAVVRDSGSDREQTLRATTELASGQVAAIIGPMVNAEVAAEEAQNQKVPIITLTLADKITEYGDFVFRNFLTPQMQIKSMVSFLVNSLGVKRFAVLYPKEKYGTTHMNLFSNEVAEQGGILAASQSYDVTMTDFRGPIQNLSGLFKDNSDSLLAQKLEEFTYSYQYYGADGYTNTAESSFSDFGAIFIPDSPAKAGMIIPQLSYYDITGVYVLGTNLWNSKNFIHLVGDYSRKAILTDGFFPGSSNPQVRLFVDGFQATYGHEPGFIEAVAYDTTMLIMEILAHNNILFRSQLRDALYQITDFPGITGKTSFDPTGEAQKSTYILYIKNNQFQELKQP